MNQGDAKHELLISDRENSTVAVTGLPSHVEHDKINALFKDVCLISPLDSAP